MISRWSMGVLQFVALSGELPEVGIRGYIGRCKCGECSSHILLHWTDRRSVSQSKLLYGRKESEGKVLLYFLTFFSSTGQLQQGRCELGTQSEARGRQRQWGKGTVCNVCQTWAWLTPFIIWPTTWSESTDSSLSEIPFTICRLCPDAVSPVLLLGDGERNKPGSYLMRPADT